MCKVDDPVATTPTWTTSSPRSSTATGNGYTDAGDKIVMGQYPSNFNEPPTAFGDWGVSMYTVGFVAFTGSELRLSSDPSGLRIGKAEHVESHFESGDLDDCRIQTRRQHPRRC